MTRWAALPAELRLMILEEVLRQKDHCWGYYAAVCEEWQDVVEAKNFRHLKLQTACLEEFERLGTRHRSLVKHIWLNIALPRYTCRSCAEPESGARKSWHGSIVTKALIQLFTILAAWDGSGSLVLEINGYCSSDSENWFKNHHFGSERDNDAGEDVYDENIIAPHQQVDIDPHDPGHGWEYGRQVQAPGALAILRIFSLIYINKFLDALPQVHAVTGLVIRRQLRRILSADRLKLLIERLPQLVSIAYERWRGFRSGCQGRHDKGTWSHHFSVLSRMQFLSV